MGGRGHVPVRALTALQVLDDTLAVKAGETLLVGGAGTVTGGLIVALAVQRGVKVFATAGPSSAERASRLGATAVVDYHDSDWPDQIRAAAWSSPSAPAFRSPTPRPRWRAPPVTVARSPWILNKT